MCLCGTFPGKKTFPTERFKIQLTKPLLKTVTVPNIRDFFAVFIA